MKRYIPNTLTLANLFSGCLAVIFAVKGDLEMASFAVFTGIFFDFFDGLAARVLKVQSPLGVQLDSLADMVTCGLTPGVVMFQLLNAAVRNDMVLKDASQWDIGSLALRIIPLFGFLITLASAYRLAKFNIDENQESLFIGLPTPANTLFILAFPLILNNEQSDIIPLLFSNLWFLLAVVFISSWMLNAKIELFALKFKTWRFTDNVIKYSFLLLSLLLLLFFRFIAIPLIIISYVLLSLINNSMVGGKYREK